MRVEQQAVLLGGMFGAKLTWPTVDERIAEFEEALVAEPARLDGADLELRRSLGLRGTGG